MHNKYFLHDFALNAKRYPALVIQANNKRKACIKKAIHSLLFDHKRKPDSVPEQTLKRLKPYVELLTKIANGTAKTSEIKQNLAVVQLAVGASLNHEAHAKTVSHTRGRVEKVAKKAEHTAGSRSTITKPEKGNNHNTKQTNTESTNQHTVKTNTNNNNITKHTTFRRQTNSSNNSISSGSQGFNTSFSNGEEEEEGEEEPQPEDHHQE